MTLPALHSKQLLAAVIFVAATLVLSVQLISPSPVVVSVGDSGARTVQLGQYFTYSDVGVISAAAAFLGASGVYLLFYDHTPQTPRESEATRNPSTPAAESPGRERNAEADDDAAVASHHREWERTAERLRNNEETVYTIVLDANGEVAQRDIVEKTDLSKATVSRTLDTLESKDLVERKRRGMGNIVVLQ